MENVWKKLFKHSHLNYTKEKSWNSVHGQQVFCTALTHGFPTNTANLNVRVLCDGQLAWQQSRSDSGVRPALRSDPTPPPHTHLGAGLWFPCLAASGGTTRDSLRGEFLAFRGRSCVLPPHISLERQPQTQLWPVWTAGWHVHHSGLA